jgi:hypothetical protein
MKEINFGRDQGLAMAARLLREHGMEEGVKVIHEEMELRGRMPVQLAVTSQEIVEATKTMKLAMYETFTCMSLMVLHDQFGFGPIRGKRFLERWNYKVQCMNDKMVNWADMIQAVKDDMLIDLPTMHMKEAKLI